MKKTKNSKSFFGYKAKGKRQNKKISYVISILLQTEENELRLMKIYQLVQKI